MLVSLSHILKIKSNGSDITAKDGVEILKIICNEFLKGLTRIGKAEVARTCI